MLYDGMFVPKEHTDGSFVWANPASKIAFFPSKKFPFREVH
jgi:hypothetical protein